MNNDSAYGALLLRVSLGALFLAHASLKIFVFTPAGTAGYFESLGLPGGLAYLTMLAEVAGGLALIAGVYVRIAAVALIPLLLGTIVMVHGANGFWFNGKGGGWEFPALWAVALAVQALIGAGAYAVRLPGRNVAATA